MPATGGLESHPVNTIHRYTWKFPSAKQVSNGISELADPGPSTSCDKALSCPDQTHAPTVAIQLVDPCNQPRSSLSSTISPAFQSLNFNVFWDFTWWRYYILWCFSEIDGTKLEKNPCHMKCSSLFMRCDAKTWYSYVLFKITWYSYMIHINLTSILST